MTSEAEVKIWRSRLGQIVKLIEDILKIFCLTNFKAHGRYFILTLEVEVSI